MDARRPRGLEAPLPDHCSGNGNNNSNNTRCRYRSECPLSW